MEAAKTGGGSLTARGKGKAPGPPRPPPSRDDANGGHRRAGRPRRSIWPRGRGVVVALVAMIAAAVFLLFADTLGAPPPSAEWLLLAFVIWIIGLNMLVRLMN